MGVEAYGAYALGAWLTPGTPERARTFARGSAIGALVLGAAGQVIYHLLAAAHAARAPWPVVVLVSCLPVITLGFGAALTHLLRVPVEPDNGPEDADEDQDEQPEENPVPEPEPVEPEVPATVWDAAKAAYVASIRGGNPISAACPVASACPGHRSRSCAPKWPQRATEVARTDGKSEGSTRSRM